MRFCHVAVRAGGIGVPLVLAVTMFSLAACASMGGGTSQGLAYSMPEGKDLKFVDADGGEGWVLDRLVYEGTQADWTEALEVMQLYRKGQPETAQEFYADLQTASKERCPNGEWTVIGDDASTITYERVDPPCSGFPAQQSLNRILYGDDLVFVMMYTKRGAFSDDERGAIHRMLASAHVASGPE